MQRSIISLVVGVVLAGIALILLSVYLGSSRPDAQANQENTGTVVVAVSDFAAGAPIHREYLKAMPWPKASVPQTSFATIDDVYVGATKEGDRIALKPIAADEPILRGNISGFGGRAIMSRQVSPGMRAFAIPVNDVSGVAGFVLPGDRVDIMLTRTTNNDSENRVTDIILQNITVLGVDQESDQTRERPEVARTATVEVTPEQAQKLALAQQVGTLSLSLRNATTVGQVQSSRIATGDLATSGPSMPGQAGPTVRIHYGPSSTVEKAVPQ